MKPRPSPVALVAVLLAACLLATGFGKKKGGPPPVFDPSASAASQAERFVAPNKAAARHMKDVGKVVITSCNVMFAYKSNASAGTAGGLFSDVGNTRRVDEKVTVEYTLEGTDDAGFQALTEALCAEAENRVRAAGFDVVPGAELAQNENYRGIHSNAKASPFEYKAPGRDSRTRYMVFAPEGQGVYDFRYIGVGAGLGAAFKQAKGESPEMYEGRVVDEMKASAMRINLLVDFAQLASDGHRSFGGLASKNKAKVSSDVRLSVSGDVTIKPESTFKCWERFGKRECMGDANKQPGFATANAVVSQDAFYREVRNATTTGDKIGAGVSKGLAVLSAMGGVSSTSFDITRYSVDVDPEIYAAEVTKYGLGFIDMALARAQALR